GKTSATASEAITGDANRPSFHRIYRAFLTARFALAVVLLRLVIGYWALGNRPAWWMVVSTMGYVIAPLSLLIWPRHAQATRPDLQSLK
ncbi:hypothetical protein, partial [Acinetobacter baumannii]|uniref:hypothetical protein n=1 Tax=Acinetobacter baumannii TaxID=470 RepID=UPI001BB468A2